jgi:streptomycin 6-kinase
MVSNFRDSLPGELVTHIRAICGRKGEEWFEQLPTTIKGLEDKWSLKVEPPFPGIEFNFVAPAIREESEQVVLKISPPFEQIEIYGEAAYLRCRVGAGAVRLLEEDRESRAILIERALPGESLSEYFKGREPEVARPMINVLQAILRPVPAESVEAATVDKWFDNLRRSASTDFPGNYVVKALTIYEKLSQQNDRVFYLHGDFHPANVVTATRSPYLAIDPKGLIGHLGYDIAVFLNNFHWWQEGRPDVNERLDAAVDQFSIAFDIDPTEIRQWAFAQMVLGAWWTFDEMPEMYKNEVVKADVWNV